jgi:hypothetical protein
MEKKRGTSVFPLDCRRHSSSPNVVPLLLILSRQTDVSQVSLGVRVATFQERVLAQASRDSLLRYRGLRHSLVCLLSAFPPFQEFNLLFNCVVCTGQMFESFQLRLPIADVLIIKAGKMPALFCQVEERRYGNECEK